MALFSLTENREEKKAAYNKMLRDILRRSDVLDAKAIKDIRRLLRDMQARITERIGGELARGKAFETNYEGKLTNWGMFWIPRLIQSVDDIVKQFSQKAGEEFAQHLLKSWELGAELVDGSIKAVAPQVGISAARISPFTLTTLAPFSAELITKIDEETRKQVNKAIRVNVSTGESPFELIKKLQTQLHGKPSPFKSVAYRAELITRTEVARAQNLAREARLQQAVAEFPELVQGHDRMQLRFIVVQRGPNPCQICRPFDGTVWEWDDPQRPNPPLHPNCRCVTSPVVRGLNATTPKPNPDSHRQADASLSECICCH